MDVHSQAFIPQHLSWVIYRLRETGQCAVAADAVALKPTQLDMG